MRLTKLSYEQLTPRHLEMLSGRDVDSPAALG